MYHKRMKFECRLFGAITLLALSGAAAAAEDRRPRIAQLLSSWGGATVAYRRRLLDSPSYTLNHEEVAKAMEEGVRFAEGLSPIAVDVDDLGHAQAIRFTREDGDKKDEVVLPARAVIIAAGGGAATHGEARRERERAQGESERRRREQRRSHPRHSAIASGAGGP